MGLPEGIDYNERRSIRGRTWARPYSLFRRRRQSLTGEGQHGRTKAEARAPPLRTRLSSLSTTRSYVLRGESFHAAGCCLFRDDRGR